MNYHILYRTGGVYDSFVGSEDAAQAECDRRNETDQGHTMVLSSFDDPDEAQAEFFRLTA